MTTAFDRRNFLRHSATATAAVVVAGGTHSLGARAAMAAPGRRGQRLEAPNNGGYGPIRPVADATTGLPLLHLPEGFSYASFGHAAAYAAALGLPTNGSDGYPTPDRHDGMAAFPLGQDRDRVRLVRNHERGYSPVPFEGSGDQPLVGEPDNAYDVRAGGATTTLTFNTATMKLEDSFISINGTSVNCAGGPTPWGSWLTCEETVNGPHNGFAAKHGYVFEVPAHGGVVEQPVPLTAMGRFTHEAVAVDPATGIVYETEDNGNTSGFYRFIPKDPQDLATGGELQMLAVKGQPQFATYQGVTDQVGKPMRVEWVTITNPDPEIAAGTTRDEVFQQGFQRGGAAFARLEGAWYDGGSIFFNATSGGDERLGQVWEYRPRGRSGGQLILLFESPSAELLDAPDNICVSPRGGLVLCEDGADEQYVRGLNDRGEIFDFALNNVSENRDKEFAGATFSPDGEVMFVNIQTPGVSFAIRGPWENGGL